MSLALAQRQYDRMEPVAVVAEEWTPLARRTVTDSDVEQFIAVIAEEGTYPDCLGMHRNAGSVYAAIAHQWVKDKEAVGQIIGPAFWQWAKSAAHVAEFGKPIQLAELPAILQKQAGLK